MKVCWKLKQKQEKGERNESFLHIHCVCVRERIFFLSIWYAEFEMEVCGVYLYVCSHRWFFCRNAKATVNKLHTNIRWIFIRIELNAAKFHEKPINILYIRLVVMQAIYYESTFISIISYFIAKREKKINRNVQDTIYRYWFHQKKISF